jgi:hypothetical protein
MARDDTSEEPVSPSVMVPAEQAERLVRAIAEKHGAKGVLRRLGHFRPDHLANAAARFARGLRPAEVPLARIDTSLLQNGKSGLLVTNRELYSSRLHRGIPLQAINEVSYEAPSGEALAGAWALVLASVVCPPLGALLAVLYLSSGGLRRLQHRLVVNGETVYSGGNPIRPAFWVELLTALAEASRQVEEQARAGRAPEAPALWAGPTRRQGLTALQLHPHSADGVPLVGELLDAPAWELVERSIRELDGHTHPRVRLWAGPPGEPPGLDIIGGNGKYALREVGNGWVYYDSNGTDEQVNVQTSGAGHRCAEYYVCTDVERVLRIARRFFESRSAGDDY